jgi:hypothetical protein
MCKEDYAVAGRGRQDANASLWPVSAPAAVGAPANAATISLTRLPVERHI